MDSPQNLNGCIQTSEAVNFTQECDDYNDEWMDGLTIRELRTRAKVKRWKIDNSYNPPSRVQLQSSQEKSDLDEPLVVLKRKLLKKNSLQTKNLKVEDLSISYPAIPEERAYVANNELRTGHLQCELNMKFENFQVISDVSNIYSPKEHRSTEASLSDARCLQSSLEDYSVKTEDLFLSELFDKSLPSQHTSEVGSDAIDHLIPSSHTSCPSSLLESSDITNCNDAGDKMPVCYFQTENECYQQVIDEVLTEKTNTVDKSLLIEMEEDSKVMEESNGCLNPSSPIVMEEDSKVMEESKDCSNQCPLIVMEEDSKVLEESKDCLNQRSLVMMEESESKESLNQCCIDSDSYTDPHSIIAERQMEKETFNFNRVIDFKQTPKKLLSNRKVISPTLQETLCWAFNTEKLYESKPFSSRRKRALLEMSGNTERMIKKQRSDTDTTKSILKPPNSSFNAQAAVKFSHMQMRDAQYITGKLVGGLRFMKDVVTKNLTISDLDERANEIEMAIEKASALEATVEKCMSTMSRDFKRFCQIMRSKEQKIPTKQSNSNNHNHKKQRKITFADEVGKSLCHIKLITDQTDSGDMLDR